MGEIAATAGDAPVRRRRLILAVLACFVVDVLGTVTALVANGVFDGPSIEEARETHRVEIYEEGTSWVITDIAFGAVMACFSIAVGWLAFRMSSPRHAVNVALVATLLITLPFMLVLVVPGIVVYWHTFVAHRFAASVIAMTTADFLVMRRAGSRAAGQSDVLNKPVFAGALVSVAIYFAAGLVRVESELDIREGIFVTAVFGLLSLPMLAVLRAAWNRSDGIGLARLALVFIVWGWLGFAVTVWIANLAPELTGRPYPVFFVDFWLGIPSRDGVRYSAMFASGALMSFVLLRRGRDLLTNSRGQASRGHRVLFFGSVAAAIWVTLDVLVRAIARIAS